MNGPRFAFVDVHRGFASYANGETWRFVRTRRNQRRRCRSDERRSRASRLGRRDA